MAGCEQAFSVDAVHVTEKMVANPYFDAEYYLRVHPDLLEQGVTLETAEQYFLDCGAEAGHKTNVCFYTGFYLFENPDLVEAGLTRAEALDHFWQQGIYEGRGGRFLALFTAEDYAGQNRDLAQQFGITDTSNLTLYQRGQL